jgi:hypothetical protein
MLKGFASGSGAFAQLRIRNILGRQWHAHVWCAKQSHIVWSQMREAPKECTIPHKK